MATVKDTRVGPEGKQEAYAKILRLDATSRRMALLGIAKDAEFDWAYSATVQLLREDPGCIAALRNAIQLWAPPQRASLLKEIQWAGQTGRLQGLCCDIAQSVATEGVGSGDASKSYCDSCLGVAAATLRGCARDGDDELISSMARAHQHCAAVWLSVAKNGARRAGLEKLASSVWHDDEQTTLVRASAALSMVNEDETAGEYVLQSVQSFLTGVETRAFEQRTAAAVDPQTRTVQTHELASELRFVGMLRHLGDRGRAVAERHLDSENLEVRRACGLLIADEWPTELQRIAADSPLTKRESSAFLAYMLLEKKSGITGGANLQSGPDVLEAIARIRDRGLAAEFGYAALCAVYGW